jgi:hypothetical protein
MTMNWIETTLLQLEGNLRDLFEGEAAGDSIPRKLHRQLIHGLIEAMKAGICKNSSQGSSNGRKHTAPDQYVMILPSAQAELLLRHPAELNQLTIILEDATRQENAISLASPILRVVANPQSEEIKIIAESSHPELGDSHTSRLEEILSANHQKLIDNTQRSYLIVNGLTIFPLNEPVINIGRDPTNHLLLEDTRISRLHAQIRLIQGRFMIFDLDSKGGTYVNGVPVTSQLLKPGDVIQLAGVPLVYGQEATVSSEYTQELPADPPPPEVL